MGHEAKPDLDRLQHGLLTICLKRTSQGVLASSTWLKQSLRLYLLEGATHLTRIS